MQSWIAEQRAERYAAAVVVAWVLINYAWTGGTGFINDDYIWIYGARPPAGGAWWRAALVAPAWSVFFVRPIVQLSFFVNGFFGRSNPVGYHLVSLALHTLNSYLVWRLGTFLLGGIVPGLLTAVLFATHPAHPDAVTWIAGRTELIAGAFYLGAVLLHLRARRVLAAVLFACALLSKESAASFPLIAVALDLLVAMRWQWRASGAYAAVLAAYLLFRAWATRQFATGFVLWSFIPRRDFVGLIGWLAHQGVQAAGQLLAVLPTSPRVSAVVLALCVPACLWATRRDAVHRIMLLAATWTVVTLLPYVGLFTFQARYIYLPSVGLALLVAAGAASAWKSGAAGRWMRPAVAVGLAGWVIASVVALQAQNLRLARNGAMSTRVIEAAAAAVPHPAPATVFVLTGLNRLRLVGDASIRGPVLLFGLTEALRLHFDDTTLDATCPDMPGNPPLSRLRPTINLQWNDQTRTFER